MFTKASGRFKTSIKSNSFLMERRLNYVKSNDVYLHACLRDDVYFSECTGNSSAHPDVLPAPVEKRNSVETSVARVLLNKIRIH